MPALRRHTAATPYAVAFAAFDAAGRFAFRRRLRLIFFSKHDVVVRSYHGTHITLPRCRRCATIITMLVTLTRLRVDAAATPLRYARLTYEYRHDTLLPYEGHDAFTPCCCYALMLHLRRRCCHCRCAMLPPDACQRCLHVTNIDDRSSSLTAA